MIGTSNKQVGFSFVCSVTLVMSNSLLPHGLYLAHQGLLSMGFFKQEYWGRLPFPPPGDLSDPGSETVSPVSPALAGGFLLSHRGGHVFFLLTWFCFLL